MGKISNTKIKYAWLDDTACGKDGMGMMLGVDFENGASIMLPLDSKAGEPLFRDIIDGKAGDPKTEAKRVYWENGASLTLKDMMAMLQAGSGKNSKGSLTPSQKKQNLIQQMLALMLFAVY